jgi:hypothetical protein
VSGRPRRASGLGVHARLEVLEALDCKLTIAGCKSVGVLFEDVEQNNE